MPDTPPHQEEPVRANDDQRPTPKWRTLKGIRLPFTVYGTANDDRGTLRPAQDRQQPSGAPFTVVTLETRPGSRTGTTDTGLNINFGGLATKVWVIPGPEPIDPLSPRAEQLLQQIGDHDHGSGIQFGYGNGGRFQHPHTGEQFSLFFNLRGWDGSRVIHRVGFTTCPKATSPTPMARSDGEWVLQLSTMSRAPAPQSLGCRTYR